MERISLRLDLGSEITVLSGHSSTLAKLDVELNVSYSDPRAANLSTSPTPADRPDARPQLLPTPLPPSSSGLCRNRILRALSTGIKKYYFGPSSTVIIIFVSQGCHNRMPQFWRPEAQDESATRVSV